MITGKSLFGLIGIALPAGGCHSFFIPACDARVCSAGFAYDNGLVTKSVVDANDSLVPVACSCEP